MASARWRTGRAHLAEVNESYFEHLVAALGISGRLIGASAACAAHAIFPGICVHTASRLMADVQTSIARRMLQHSAAGPDRELET
jgi:hypothetical protein